MNTVIPCSLKIKHLHFAASNIKETMTHKFSRSFSENPGTGQEIASLFFVFD